MRKARATVLIVAALAVAGAGTVLAAPRAGSAALSRERLTNGLEVVVAENDAVPLATVCVVFRGGAAAQKPETAGLFHLYEHMLFDGNEKYPTQADFTAAINRLGSPGWNGATGREFIEYYLTVPADKLAEGVEFWSWAVRKPVFEAGKLEREKRVVISEIRGYHVDPDHVADEGLESRIFADYPERKNIDGPEETVQGATIAQLEEIRAGYYIPRNMALIVGGDVKAAEVFALARKFFGDWTGGPAPVIGRPPQGKFPQGIRLVYPDDQYYQGIAQSEIRWRGPDAALQPADTYAADVLSFLLSSPAGRFKSELMKSGLGLYDPEYIGFGSPLTRDGGEFRFSAILRVDPADGGVSVLGRNEALRKFVDAQLTRIAADPSAYFGAEALGKAVEKIIDRNLISAEVASSYVTSTLAFWWAVADPGRILGYEANYRRIGWADVAGVAKRYLEGAPSATLLRIREDAYRSDVRSAQDEAELGYAELRKDNAFWWQWKGATK